MLHKNILLIDDDDDDAELFCEAILVVGENVDCLTETNPIKALENLKNGEYLPDLIFLDYNMPVLNGNEFLKKMKEVQQLRKIPVILYSSYSESAAEHLCITQDADRYITKPNNFEQLTAVLKDILVA